MQRPIVFTLLAAFQLSSARAEDPTCEVWSYTGTDIYPSALIATATVDWHEGEHEEDEKPSEDKEVGAEGRVAGSDAKRRVRISADERSARDGGAAGVAVGAVEDERAAPRFRDRTGRTRCIAPCGGGAIWRGVVARMRLL